MASILARISNKLFVKLENAAQKSALRELRKMGHDIAGDLRLGRRSQIDVHPTGRLTIRPNVEILQDSWIVVEENDRMEIGENVFISQHCTISGSVSIGRDSLIAGYVGILDANHVTRDPDRPIRMQGGEKRPVIIGEDVWIGTSTIVLPGTKIGAHSVIGANSTVTRDIPEWTVAAGSPAGIIRAREH
jgi:acetyltransferase-like isoleucine patch superfamily enzyme